MTTRVLSWDWREQPNLAQLATAITELSGGRMHLREIQTDTDDYAIVIADQPLTDAEARRIYEEAP